MSELSKRCARLLYLSSVLAVAATASSLPLPGPNWVAGCDVRSSGICAIVPTSLQLAPEVAAALGLPTMVSLEHLTGDANLIAIAPGGDTISVDVYSLFAPQPGGDLEIFFQLDWGDGIILHNQEALILTTLLADSPNPNGPLFQPLNFPLGLFQANGSIGGRLETTGRTDVVNPEPATAFLLAGGLLAVLGSRLRKPENFWLGTRR